MTKSILIRIKAKVSDKNGGQDWSPQTDEHLSFLVKQGMERTGFEWELVEITHE